MLKKKTYTIGEASVDFKDGFLVAVKTDRGRLIYLTDVSDDLELAQEIVNIINQGHWVGTRKSKGCTFTVEGRKLTATWNTK